MSEFAHEAERLVPGYVLGHTLFCFRGGGRSIDARYARRFGPGRAHGAAVSQGLHRPRGLSADALAMAERSALIGTLFAVGLLGGKL